jgi:beta-glucosidase
MAQRITRRTFAQSAGAAAVGAALGGPPSATAAYRAHEDAAFAADSPGFPAGFLWGTATAAYQVEGAAAEDGRRPSVWDTFSHTPGKTVNGATGDVANDHYHRYEGDVQLMKALGVKAYRFSIAWPRVFPAGDGQPNAKGLDFYNRLVDELLANGIEPFATLYHWDLPQTLQDRVGGWESRETSKAFAEYAGYVAKHLSDRVKRIFTINEFGAFVELGYRVGVHAPGLKLPPARFNQTRHHAVLGHGLAVQAIRASAAPGTRVGVAENMTICVPVIESKEHVDAAVRATREVNAPYMTVILGPEALYWGPRHMANIWKATEIFITENGCSSSDVPAADGKVYDTDRVMYLRNYLTQLQRATSEGVPVHGYFLWSLMDNFEWADGFTNRFGIHFVDYRTQKRTPKLSADFYREVIARNAVV